MPKWKRKRYKEWELARKCRNTCEGIEAVEEEQGHLYWRLFSVLLLWMKLNPDLANFAQNDLKTNKRGEKLKFVTIVRYPVVFRTDISSCPTRSPVYCWFEEKENIWKKTLKKLIKKRNTEALFSWKNPHLGVIVWIFFSILSFYFLFFRCQLLFFSYFFIYISPGFFLAFFILWNSRVFVLLWRSVVEKKQLI